jgi:UDP-2-acetamido-3-amino-2,3-dideoxy-glucuronate N-acetyltransferase
VNSPSSLIHPTGGVAAPRAIGAGTRVWHCCRVVAQARIGARCRLGRNVWIAGVAGDNVRLQNNLSLHAEAELEDDLACGPSRVPAGVLNPRSEIPRRDRHPPTRVRRGATIGANATVVCGITIGRDAFPGADSVIRSDLSDHAVRWAYPPNGGAG